MNSGNAANLARTDRIRYGQVWEDADVLLAALRVKTGDTVVSIASAGDNVLALLTADPARIVAVDLSPSQLECLRLRIAAYRSLDHPALLELMGSRRSTRRGELLAQAAGILPASAQAFWLAHRLSIVEHGLGGIGRFERYFRLFRRFVLPLAHGGERIAALLTPKPLAGRRQFFSTTWNNCRWRALMRLFFSRAVMGRFGREREFFRHAQGSLADHVARKTFMALTVQEPADNPYLHWILTGTHGAALPVALRAENFAAIRARLDRIELRQQSLDAYCAEAAAANRPADAFNLSDIFEYMSPEAFAASYSSVIAAGRPGARLVHWNMMVPRGIPAACAPSVRRNDTLAESLKARDRAFFYSDLIVSERVE